jgi:hypothetical protein
MPGISITLDEATPLLERCRTAAQAQGLALVGGRAAATLVKEHLFGIDGQRHQYGNHFYAQAARSVNVVKVPAGAAVNITSQGFAQRLFGGDIVPKEAHWLTIPARAEAMAHRAREFNDLHFVFFREGLAALVQNLQTRLGGRVRGSVTPKGKSGETGGGIFFWLVKFVHQEPDPTVLPYDEQMSARAADAIATRFQRLSDRANPAPSDS